jgi:hypothetical protein
MNRSIHTTGRPADKYFEPTSNSDSSLGFPGEVDYQPSQPFVSSSPQQDDVLASRKGAALATVPDIAHVVPVTPTAKDVSPWKKNPLRRNPDLLRHFSEDSRSAIVLFTDSSDHMRPIQRRHSHSDVLQRRGNLRHFQESLDTQNADDEKTTRSSNCNSFATDGTRSDRISSIQSYKSSQGHAGIAAIPESVKKESTNEVTNNLPLPPASTFQQFAPSKTESSSTGIEEITLAMSKGKIDTQRQKARPHPTVPTHPLSMIRQYSALEDDQSDENQRILIQLEDAASMSSTTSMPSLSSIHVDEVSYFQSTAMQSTASMSSSSSDMKHSDSLNEEHASESSSSSEPCGNTSHHSKAKEEGKTETKNDTLNQVMSPRKPKSDQKDVPPSFVSRSIDGTFRGGVPLEVPRRVSPMTEDRGVPFLAKSKRPAMSDYSSPATPRIRNPKTSSKEIVSTLQALDEPFKDTCTGVSYNSNDSIPRAARRRSSSSESSFSATS